MGAVLVIDPASSFDGALDRALSAFRSQPVKLIDPRRFVVEHENVIVDIDRDIAAIARPISAAKPPVHGACVYQFFEFVPVHVAIARVQGLRMTYDKTHRGGGARMLKSERGSGVKTLAAINIQGSRGEISSTPGD